MPKKEERLTVGQRAADSLTRICGSWVFIMSVLLIILLWIVSNILLLIFRWDPYPFILLNLVLSCLAAMQAPIILMSQNRQSERDREAELHDYRVDVKAEKEIENIQKDLDEIKAILRKNR